MRGVSQVFKKISVKSLVDNCINRTETLVATYDNVYTDLKILVQKSH